ncbi:MAG: formyltransferase family protein [Weeksellaceae bacterium]|nr:formyltransferase family protein [Weeksellaceae bacterium]
MNSADNPHILSSEKIAIITYNAPHRKTQDLVLRLISLGINELHLLALPFVERPNPYKPIYAHRPSKAIEIAPQEWAQNLRIGFQEIDIETLHTALEEFKADKILIAGAGILPANVVQEYDCINSHPAYLPHVRGLDALKWAVVQKQPIAVTTHIVDNQADAGYFIDQQEVPVYKNDTFYHLAIRQYELEIQMLADTVGMHLEKRYLKELQPIGNVNRRMPASIERNLLQYFEEYKAEFAV